MSRPPHNLSPLASCAASFKPSGFSAPPPPPHVNKVSVQRSGIDTTKYHTWLRIPKGKWQTHNWTPQTRAKRSALSQQVTTRHTQRQSKYKTEKRSLWSSVYWKRQVYDPCSQFENYRAITQYSIPQTPDIQWCPEEFPHPELFHIRKVCLLLWPIPSPSEEFMDKKSAKSLFFVKISKLAILG